VPYFRAFAFVAVMAASLILVAPIQALARRRGWPIQQDIQMGFCRVICAIIGLRVHARGGLPGNAPRLVVANHVSWTDVIALSSLHPFVFLAKSEVARWPALGFLARLQGAIFVDRGARMNVARVNDALAGALREGRDLVIFAEGTSSDGTQVLPFNSAHFGALEVFEGDATVAPAAIGYDDGERWIDVGWYGDMTFLPHLWSLMKRGGAQCRIDFGDAISPRGKNRKKLATETQARVRELLFSARAHAARRSDPPK
jgi:1-acyl-sn-glycerol-3-phosphate acyltransferase